MSVIRDLPREYAHAMRACTPTQRKWLREMQSNGFRPYRAALKLKCSEASVTRWRQNPQVQKVMAVLTDMADLDIETSMVSLQTELRAVAKFDVRELYNEDGTLKAPSEWGNDAAAAIASIDVEQRHTKAPDGTTLTEMMSTSKVRTHNKLAAIEQLLHMRDLHKPKRFELTGKDGKDLIPPSALPSDADIARRLLFILERGAQAATPQG